MISSLRPLLLCAGLSPLVGAEPTWRHLSTANGDLPLPGAATEQTAAIVADFDRDGKNDFIVTARKVAPAVVLYRRTAGGWDRQVIEPAMLRVEAGGAVHDIDGDGDPDLVFGGDGQTDELWWWENPHPQRDPAVPWVRRTIKRGGGRQHHDQAFGDFLGTGRAQLAFWNQRVKKLFLAEIPADPRTAELWPLTEIFSETVNALPGFDFKFAEGMAAADIDADGRLDLVAGNVWFKHRGGARFDAIRFSDVGGRVAVGRFKPGKHPQIVIASADWNGPLRFIECQGDPANPADWHGRDLLDREMVRGHSLEVADIDGDGQLDIFAAEMAKWMPGPAINNPDATAWIFYGDGRGGFRRTVFQTAVGFHEARLADLDGDGRTDILSKPYTWNAPRIDVWLQASAAAAVGRAPAGIGFALYSFAREAAKDLPGAMARVRALGLADVEVPPGLFGQSAAGLRAELDRAGLACTSLIAGYEELATGLDAVAANAKALGAKFVVCARIPHQRSATSIFTVAQAEKAAHDFNAWGARFRAHGLQFCYHPHGFEFRPLGAGTVFDRLAELTHPRDVQFELDVFWVVYPGRDPAALLRKYPGRFPLMHLKDVQRDAAGDHSGKAPHVTSVALGTGKANWPSIFAAAREAGVKHFYIEDESPESPRQVPESLRYLGTVVTPP